MLMTADHLSSGVGTGGSTGGAHFPSAGPNMGGGGRTTLLIPDLDPEEDGGVYRCRGTNVWGQVQAEFPVKVHGESKWSQLTLFELVKVR